MFEKLTVDAVFGFFKRTWPLFVGFGLCLALLISQMQLRHANLELKQEAGFRAVLKDTLDAPKADGPTLIITARARVSESKDRKTALTRISTETVAAKKRADFADAQLRREQADNAKKFAAAHAEIKALQNRKPTGDATKDTAVIDEDSKAAWKGWK